jgi:hypothetical protein
MILTALLPQVGTATAADCALTGLCGLVALERPVASGVFFVALGLVALGTVGLRRGRRTLPPQ